jgi:hypothetical protein
MLPLRSRISRRLTKLAGLAVTQPRLKLLEISFSFQLAKILIDAELQIDWTGCQIDSKIEFFRSLSFVASAQSEFPESEVPDDSESDVKHFLLSS